MSYRADDDDPYAYGTGVRKYPLTASDVARRDRARDEVKRLSAKAWLSTQELARLDHMTDILRRYGEQA